ncbi:MAG TPA: MarR family winged helix-turn-helix transcriptional regulator [Verrucomicrobiae bacterium]|nr:MarR family winged helix-turn-helix transcriptional regulator [Verrucomicrobiae bacterium]
MDTVPLILRFIRSQMRRHRIAGLSVTQFRVLLFISRCRGSSLSAVADHVGLSLPSVSRMADNLATRGLLVRRPRPDDRRGISLRVTPRGERAVRAALNATQADLAEKLGRLNGQQRTVVVRSMQALRPVFASPLSPKRRSAG